MSLSAFAHDEIAQKYLRIAKAEGVSLTDFEKALALFALRRFHLDEMYLGSLSDPFSLDLNSLYGLMPTINIEKLADISIEAMIAEAGGDPSLSRPSLSCDGATSGDIKRILFILVVQKQLGVKIDANDSVDLSTIPLLAQKLYRLKHE